MKKCSSGKRVYESEVLAEDALIDAWGRSEFNEGNGPISVYQCDDCGYFHFTSRGPMNDRLRKTLDSGKLKREREANQWLDKFKRR